MTELYKAEKITDRISRIVMPGAVFAYIVEGDEKATLIDTGFGLGPFREYVEERLQKKPYELILTHGHLDHAGGASEFEKVYMNGADLPIARKHTQKQMRKQFLENSGHEVKMEDLAEPMEEGYLPLSYGQSFDLGNETIEIVDLGGHTPGSIGVLIKKERILLAGDACCSFTLLFGHGESLNISEYRDRLQKTWDQYHEAFDTMIYSHPHNYGGKEVMSQMIELCDEILSGKDDHIQGPGLFDAVTYIGKKVNEKGRRIDGKIANLQYSGDCLA